MKTLRQPTLQEVTQKVTELAMAQMGQAQIVSDNFQSILAAMEIAHPGFTKLYDRARFMQNCLVAFRAQADARRGSDPNALEFLKEAQETLGELKKMGKESGWQSAYINAEQNVAKEVQVMEKVQREAAKSKLEIVKS